MKQAIFMIVAVIVFLLISLSGYGGVIGFAYLVSLLCHLWVDFVIVAIVYWICVAILFLTLVWWVLFTKDEDEYDEF